MKKSPERRKHKRFLVDEGVLAILKPHPIRMGRVVDISIDGLGVEYFNDKAWPGELSTISVLTSSPFSRLEDIPIRTVDDNDILDPASLGEIEKRCRSMQFCNLTPEQRRQIDEFVREHAAVVGPSG